MFLIKAHACCLPACVARQQVMMLASVLILDKNQACTTIHRSARMLLTNKNTVTPQLS
ncbi:MAG: hypothetical protein Q7U12_08240 [Undibacterium sp.]|nr:hypothetical protein [Undibacterium sp.]